MVTYRKNKHRMHRLVKGTHAMLRQFRFLAAAVIALTLASSAKADTRVTQIIAHRGSSADRPECTLVSIQRAIAAGATAVEVDVRTTKDGHLVILHDATLDRTTNGSGKLQDKTLVEVRQLDAGSWFDPKYRAQRVPTLKEVLVLCKGKIDVLLDLKQQGDEYNTAVVAEVKAHGSPKRTIVGVRSVDQALLFRRLLPQAKQLGLIPNQQAIEAFAKAGVKTIRLWPKWLKNDANLVRRVRKTGAKLHLNGTTGKPDDVFPLLLHKPDSLSSDDPARLVKTLKEL
jgi:glycerophosphoryl diester phosphodiesterase